MSWRTTKAATAAIAIAGASSGSAMSDMKIVMLSGAAAAATTMPVAERDHGDALRDDRDEQVHGQAETRACEDEAEDRAAEVRGRHRPRAERQLRDADGEQRDCAKRVAACSIIGPTCSVPEKSR